MRNNLYRLDKNYYAKIIITFLLFFSIFASLQLNRPKKIIFNQEISIRVSDEEHSSQIFINNRNVEKNDYFIVRLVDNIALFIIKVDNNLEKEYLKFFNINDFSRIINIFTQLKKIVLRL